MKDFQEPLNGLNPFQADALSIHNTMAGEFPTTAIRSGDEHPNPGPGRHEASASDDNNLTMYQHQLQGPGQQQSVIKYDKAALINLKYHSRIEYTVWATIRSLGITAKRST